MGISLPPAGMQPKGVPMAVARSQAGHERPHSSRVMCTLLRRLRDSTVRASYSTKYSASATANRPTAISTTSSPSINSGVPRV